MARPGADPGIRPGSFFERDTRWNGGGGSCRALQPSRGLFGPLGPSSAPWDPEKVLRSVETSSYAIPKNQTLPGSPILGGGEWTNPPLFGTRQHGHPECEVLVARLQTRIVRRTGFGAKTKLCRLLFFPISFRFHPHAGPRRAIPIHTHPSAPHLSVNHRGSHDVSPAPMPILQSIRTPQEHLKPAPQPH